MGHLAGAIGTEVWLMLPSNAEWRWGTDRQRTNWYKNHRIYRQEKHNDWKKVVEKIEKDLIKRMSCKERKRT